MSDPTRLEIEADVTRPTQVVEYDLAGVWTAVNADYVRAIGGVNDIGTGSSGLEFGAQAQSTVDLTLEQNATTGAIAWAGVRMRIRFGFAASNQLVRLTGIATQRQRSTNQETIELSIVGYHEQIAKVAIYSPLRYRRLAFTATTLVSVEDPSNPVYAGGLGNYILWTAGGRPVEQILSYPGAAFYYSCQPSLMAPEWSWCAGENAWSELDRLCKSCGGQIFQQPDGTITYVSPIVLTSSGYSADEGDYQALTETMERDNYIAAARCQFSTRRLQTTQIVYEDKIPRMIGATASEFITITMDRPVFDFQTLGLATVPPEDVTFHTVYSVQTYSYPICFVAILSFSATRLELQIANNHSAPVWLSRLIIRGRPIAVVEEGQETYGSGQPEREVSDGAIYIQSRAHARRLARLYVDVYGAMRPARQLSKMGYDPDRQLGEVMNLTLTSWSIVDAPHRISRIAVTDDGSTMDLTLVSTTGIPTADDLYLVGNSYSGGDTKQLGW